MKKLISAMLALALATGMAACGENSDSSKAESKAASEKITDTSVSEPAKEAETTTTTTEPEKEEPSFFTADEEKIKSDLQENYDFLEKAKLTIDNVTIDKRMTTEETKEDIVYITADFTGPMCKGTLKGQAKYLLFNEGWDYDSFESEEVTSELTKEPTEEDFNNLYKELFKPDENTEIINDIGTAEIKESPDNDVSYTWTNKRDVRYTDDLDGQLHTYDSTEYLIINVIWSSNTCLWSVSYNTSSSEGDVFLTGPFYTTADFTNVEDI